MKLLEVNNIDLIGNRFNGYDMMEELNKKEFDIKQVVLIKQSNNKRVIPLLDTPSKQIINDKLEDIERKQSIKNVLSITSPLLRNTKEYKEADVIHFHMFHNCNLSLYALKKMAEEKKVVLSLHDPWFLTGRCVHFYDCMKWKDGCKSCERLDNLFPMREDNCNDMWNLKKNVMDNLDIDIVVSSPWMRDLTKESQIFQNQKNIHLIPFGIDEKKFQTITKKEARKHFNIPEDDVVLFLRAQNEFKGTPYVLEALKKLNTKQKITVLTCDNKNLLDEVKEKYNIIDLGLIKDDEMIKAMNACDIFLMPSIGESFGMMAIEAMACKKPVVVFNNSALPSVTHAPECGYLVKDKDAEDLRKAIKHLVEDKEDREKRGKLGYQIIQKEYTNETYNERLEKLYRDVYKRKSEKKKKEKIEETENAKQFKFFLNDLTIRIYGTKSKEKQALWFDTKGLKRKKNYRFQFADFALQEVLETYSNELAKCIQDNSNIDNGKKIKIEKLLYFLRTNPKGIKEILKK